MRAFLAKNKVHFARAEQLWVDHFFPCFVCATYYDEPEHVELLKMVSVIYSNDSFQRQLPQRQRLQQQLQQQRRRRLQRQQQQLQRQQRHLMYQVVFRLIWIHIMLSHLRFNASGGIETSVYISP